MKTSNAENQLSGLLRQVLGGGPDIFRPVLAVRVASHHSIEFG
jgi:hypothetical protein